VSISQEVGYARPEFAPDSWTYELRPIIDKQMDRWYVSINPTFEKSLRGPNSSKPFEFTPNVDVGYDVTKKINLAVESYGATGTINRVGPRSVRRRRDRANQRHVKCLMKNEPADWRARFRKCSTLFWLVRRAAYLPASR
jgi:hypothetical protein